MPSTYRQHYQPSARRAGLLHAVRETLSQVFLMSRDSHIDFRCRTWQTCTASGWEARPAVPSRASTTGTRYAPVPERGATQARGLSSTGVLMPSKIQSLRRQAFQHQHGRCFYCSVAMWLLSSHELPGGAADKSGYARLRCTAEHLVARCEGGKDSTENIVAACAHCNGTRHKRKRPPPPTVYREEVRGRVGRGAWHHPWVHQRGLVACAIGLPTPRVAIKELQLAEARRAGPRASSSAPCVR
jgi:hypothetical protein